MDVSENIGTPESSHFDRVFDYKPYILGYPYFWKHPNPTLHSLILRNPEIIFSLPGLGPYRQRAWSHRSNSCHRDDGGGAVKLFGEKKPKETQENSD